MKIKFLDQAGTITSFLCAIHCLALPLLIAILPTLGVAWINKPFVDRTFLLAAFLFAVIAHPRGYRRHRKCLPVILASLGLVEIVVAISIFDEHQAHHYAVALGGLLVASSHILNRHLCHGDCHDKCS